MTSRKRRRKGAKGEEVDPFDEFMELTRAEGPPCNTPQKRVFNNMWTMPAEDRDRVAQKHFSMSWGELVQSLGEFPAELEAFSSWFDAELNRITLQIKEFER